jgi:hypothetical protein
MKKSVFVLLVLIIVLPIFSSFYDYSITKVDNEKICFVLRGNQETDIFIGVGQEVGKGACCSGVSKFSYVTFCGKVGEVVYDSKSNRVLMKIHQEMKGKTIELKDYY